MISVSLDEERVKALLKQAMAELLEERREYFYDLSAEVMEDAALANAIREGESTEPVVPAEIRQILDE